MKIFNICIIRPPGYIWSSVFFEIAELLSFSLEDIGYQTQISENYLHPNGRNIIIGCHLLDESLAPLIPPETILLNTEQIGAHSKWNDRVISFLRKFPSWDYSQQNIDQLHKLGISTVKYLQIGYHKKLERISAKVDKDIDVLFYGSASEQRTAILDQLETNGLKVSRLFGVFDKERDSYIARSKIILNLHYYETKIFEIVRVHYLMNNSKAIVAQCDEQTKIDVAYKDGLLLARYEDIVSSCVNAVQSEELREQYEQSSLETIKKIDSVSVIHELIG